MRLELGLGLPPGATWTPNDLFGSADTGDWWNASIGDRVWQDTSGATPSGNGDVVGRLDGLKNGKHLTQGTSGDQPIRNYSGGLWYLTFDGSNDALGPVSFTINQPFTRISALAQVSWSLNDTLFDGNGASKGRLYQSGSSPQLAVTAGSAVSIGSVATGTNAVITEIFNGASSKFAINNGSYTTGNPGAANPDGLLVGQYGGGGANANMNLFGIIMISRVLTDGEIAKCRTYLGRLAGLTL